MVGMTVEVHNAGTWMYGVWAKVEAVEDGNVTVRMLDDPEAVFTFTPLGVEKCLIFH